jgi:hypothetical protein
MADATEPEGIGIRDVKVALERTFPGVDVTCPNSMGGSFHANISFFEYSIRVILTGRRNADRGINFRFMQESKGPGNRTTKRIINEFQTTDPKVLQRGIAEAKEHLLGVTQAIRAALRPKPVQTTRSVADLLRQDD